MEKPLVTVIIPTYKRAEMLQRAINSVLEQSYEKVEVVVVDDNNPESEWRSKTASIMEQYAADSRVRYICHPKNLNGSAARNTGISQANGEIVTFLDDDDIYLPDKVTKQVDYLLSHPDIHCAVCGWNRGGKDTIPPEDEAVAYNLLSGEHLILTITIMMWKNDALLCGGFDTTFKRHQEASFILRYLRNGGKIGIVREVLVSINMEDRSNEAAPKQNEEQILHYLNTFPDMINRCEEQRPGSKRAIWMRRYRGIFSVYIKNFQFAEALQLYRRASKEHPDLWKYLLKYYLIELPKNIA